MDMHIDEYRFGKITINQREYTSDVIIYPDRVDASWWRKQGHYLQEADLVDIVAACPDTIIIGTGYYGVMKVPESTLVFLKSKGIDVHVHKTSNAATLFNNRPRGSQTIFAAHLTC